MMKIIETPKSDNPGMPGEKLVRIVDNVYAYVDAKNSSKDNSFGANAGIIIGKNGIAVVDTLISAKEARRFIKDIRAISDKPIKYVINTHYHFDHSFGNAEFVKLGATVIAHEKNKQAAARIAETILQNPEQWGLTRKDLEGTTIAYPELSFIDFMAIDLGDQIIELRHAGHSHTDGDILVCLPDKKVIFCGDILFTNYHVFLGEGNIGEWCKELEGVLNMDVKAIVPGHGPVSNKKDVESMIEYLLCFDQQARALAAEGADLQSAVDQMKTVLPFRAENSHLIQENLAVKYFRS